MYDFINFIDMLSQKEDSFKKALESVKDDFHIGKIEIKSNDFLERLEYVFDNNYVAKSLITYTTGGYEYTFYKNSDNHKYNDVELNDNIWLIS